MKNSKFVSSVILGFVITFVLAAGARGDGFTATGGLGANRYNHTATRLLDGRVLVVGGYGYEDSGPGVSAELYNPATGTWTNTSSLDDPRVNHTATLLPNGKVLVAGGVFNSGYGPFGVNPELYNPTNGTWSVAGGAGGHYYGHTATLLPGGKVLIAGGVIDVGAGFQSITKSAMLYDSAANSSVSTGNLGKARYFHTATLLTNGQVLVAGGGTNTAELYNPATGTWTNTGSLGTARSSHTATLLPNGKVLVVGGGTNTAELYNPATGTWSPTGNPAASGSATLLPNGQVLVVGIIVGTIWGQDTPIAELYDPATGTWSTAGSPVSPHSGQTATLLSSGQVLVAGGFYNAAELYASSLNPITSLMRLSDGSIQFSFSNPSGTSYHALASTNVAAPLNTWSNLGPATETPLGSGQFRFTDHQATNYPRRFYRVSSP
jgi:WD40 repeat protein